MSKPDVVSEILERGRQKYLSCLTEKERTKYEWIRVPVEREEEPDTVDLTAEEVQAILAAIIVADDFRVAERLETTKYQASHFLNEAYTKLKDD